MKKFLVAVPMTMVLVSTSVWADSLQAQRERYQAIKQAWDAKQMDEVERLLPTLQEYPLYPYLEYRELTQDLDIISPKQAQTFIDSHPTLPVAQTLKARFVNELARRQEWKSLLEFSPQEPKPAEAQCNYYFANWATGNKSLAWQGAEKLWLNGRSMPEACDKLFNEWEKAGYLTPEMILERIHLAIEAGNTSIAAYLAKRLPPSYKTIGDALVKLQNDPSSVTTFAKSMTPTDFSRQATIAAFSRYARQSPDAARTALPSITSAQKMNMAESQKLKDSIAWQYMGDVTPEQANWRDQVIGETDSTSLKERRVRLALGQGDKKGLAAWLRQLPAEAKNKEEWQYWQAITLIDAGQKAQGEEILRKLLNSRGFYPMVAAQKLGTEYPLYIKTAEKPDNSHLDNLAQIQRVRELMYWEMDNLARSEWINLVASLPVNQQEQLARYAFDHNWADLSVQATIKAKLWDHLEERFPLAWEKEFNQYTQDKMINKSYAMAIARQESAWNPQARSPVGATGLMQLMPATAKHTAQKQGISHYVNVSQLTNPIKNIEIGTAYLDDVYQQFSRNRILSSAAYNAGPSRVNRWLGNSGGRLDAVAFVESIPFSETRGYVKNVLSYDVFYRYFMGNSGPVLTDNEWLMKY
ncbi:murein transglycosylase [Providencia sneebia]|uniref:peptidoglycan lytic exotransglycosylase n=1 Tax=Providencia sneebia DSM 19967 TaxID=1141660 RepID=K8WBI5_9GAMM|nr:murein transglycosylase [Providencia sneebia]EKT53615.1 lytic murein transglycosylase [Providencia sneebia DSM 19967]